mgnify:CR=1 FL=1
MGLVWAEIKGYFVINERNGIMDNFYLFSGGITTINLVMLSCAFITAVTGNEHQKYAITLMLKNGEVVSVNTPKELTSAEEQYDWCKSEICALVATSEVS